MKAIAWFLGGLVAGTALVQVSIAQDRARRGLNHIGIGTKNYDAALAFYRDTLGAKEAFTIRNPRRERRESARARKHVRLGRHLPRRRRARGLNTFAASPSSTRPLHYHGPGQRGQAWRRAGGRPGCG